jgi:putative selenium metabolism hydrolase
MDTVKVSSPEAWCHAPLGGEIEDGWLYGVGACDQKGGLAAMIYGAGLLHCSGLPLMGDLVLACVVDEEPCEGLGTRVLMEGEALSPNWVVITEPSDLAVMLGHRGRLEMQVTVQGRSAHGASPHLGDNAVYRAAELMPRLQELAGRLAKHPVLGAGTLAVTEISSLSASRNAIPYRCQFIIDRRLTLGEDENRALAEIEGLISATGLSATVAVTEYQATSYTGYPARAREYYPAWLMAEDDPLITAAVRVVEDKLGHSPQVGCWEFSTEGTYTAGVTKIPTVGLGPGDPLVAHTVDERIRLADVSAAAEIYAQLAARLLDSR